MMAAMARRFRNREADQHGELIVGKYGVYIVRGDQKLKSIRLVPWEQLLSCDEVRAGFNDRAKERLPFGLRVEVPNPERQAASPVAEQAQDRPRHTR